MNIEKLKPITLEDQIHVLEDTIIELEAMLEKNNQEEDRPYNHNGKSIPEMIGMTHEQCDELARVVKFKIFQSQGAFSEVFEFIEKANVPIREKLWMSFVLTSNIVANVRR